MSNEISMSEYVRLEEAKREQERFASAIAFACELVAGNVISRYVPPEMHGVAFERVKLDIKQYLKNSYGVKL